MITTVRRLVVADRCDRCGARAQIELSSPVTGLALLFCGHHFSEHADKLREGGAMITGSCIAPEDIS